MSLTPSRVLPGIKSTRATVFWRAFPVSSLKQECSLLVEWPASAVGLQLQLGEKWIYFTYMFDFFICITDNTAIYLHFYSRRKTKIFKSDKKFLREGR